MPLRRHTVAIAAGIAAAGEDAGFRIDRHALHAAHLHRPFGMDVGRILDTPQRVGQSAAWRSDRLLLRWALKHQHL